MTVKLADIAASLKAKWAGDGAYEISKITSPDLAMPGELALAMTPGFAEQLKAGQGEVAVLWPGADWQAMGLLGAIFVDRPRFAMAGLTGMFAPGPDVAAGIHPTAVIDASAEIGAGAAIGAFVMIGAGVRIGAEAQILAHVTIAKGAIIGARALLHSGVRIGASVLIGDDFIAHGNAVVGSDGFSFVTAEPSVAEQVRSDFKSDGSGRGQSYARIASTAAVQIGDEVELGACSTIDRGTIAPTTIGDGTKIDNHVQIGHNVEVGRHCLLCAHVAIAGSSKLGDFVVLGGQAGVGDHLVIGDHVIAGGASAILSNVPAGRVVMGYPAMKMEQNINAYKALRRLPRLVQKVAALEAKLAETTDKTPSNG